MSEDDGVTPVKLDLKKTQGLTVTWSDGRVDGYSLSLLRTMCPCALCRTVRSDPKVTNKPKTSLNILPGNFAAPLSVTHAELVGNYALRIDWSDEHSSGIYSFEYLRSIAPVK